SASSRPTECPMRDSARAKLQATVLLPTPPLPLITKITCFAPGTGSSGPISRAAITGSVMAHGAYSRTSSLSNSLWPIPAAGEKTPPRRVTAALRLLDGAAQPGDDHAQAEADPRRDQRGPGVVPGAAHGRHLRRISAFFDFGPAGFALAGHEVFAD